MCEFRCDVCRGSRGGGGEPFGTFSYEVWVNHLLTTGHQAAIKRQLHPRGRWRDEEESFVVTCPVKDQPLPWKYQDLAEWISTYGVLAQFVAYDNFNFCIVTIKSFGEGGRFRVSSLVNETEFQDMPIMVKAKVSYGRLDWNALYGKNNNESRPRDELPAKKPGSAGTGTSAESLANSASGSKNEKTRKPPKGKEFPVPQTTLIFTNKNKSTNNSPGAASGSDKKPGDVNSVLQNLSNLSLDPKEQPLATQQVVSTPKKRKKKAKGSTGVGSVEGEARRKSEQGSEPREDPMPKEMPTPEPLNFRGGFTPSGRHGKTSESSSGSGQVNEPVINPPSSGTSTRIDASKVQILKREGSSSAKKLKTQNGLPPDNRKNGRSDKPPFHDVVVPRPSTRPSQTTLLISPTFTSQVNPAVADLLVNPLQPIGNPYIFDRLRQPLSRFFELFQRLLDPSSANIEKTQKLPMFKHFNGLSLSCQVLEFFLSQALSAEEIRIRWQVVQDILFVLRQRFPRCEVYAFGSIVTGLGDWASDIDVYVDLQGESTSPKPTDPSQRISGIEAVRKTKGILRKSQCPHNRTWFVKNLVPVTSARVPILKMTHLATNINCDLSFENRLSVQNTKLLSLYLNSDLRIYQFVVFVRYWAKFHNLTGSNHIKNYAVALLVLVYLTKKGYVPSVSRLQRLNQDERQRKKMYDNPEEIDGWDASFSENLSGTFKDPVNLKPLPAFDVSNNNNNPPTFSRGLVQLATGFFEMFANVDFSKLVACPLLGDFVSKDGFRPGNEEMLPDALDRYKNWAVNQGMARRFNINTPLCVQDPFVLSFNVGGVTPEGTLLRFQIACAKSLQVLRQPGDLKLLTDLFVPLPEHIGEKKFMKTYRTEMMAKELSREIKSAVDPGAVVTASIELTNRCTFVKLPPHLNSFDPFLDQKNLKKLTKKGRWELFTDFSVTSWFEDLFVSELTRWDIKPGARSQFRGVLVTLWTEFTEDFMEVIIESGLKLFPTDPKERIIESFESQDLEGGDDVKEEGKRKQWKPKQLGRPEELKIKEQTAALQLQKSVDELEALRNKFAKLKATSGGTKYKTVNYIVTYPFWEKRQSMLEEARSKLKKEDFIRIPVLANPRSKAKKERKGKTPKGKKGSQQIEEGGETMMGDEKSGFWNSFNPVDLEAVMSQLVTDRFLESEDVNKFNDFNIGVLIKLDSSSATDRPAAYVCFEKDPRSNANDHLRAAQCLSNIMIEAYPYYLVYRLGKWFDMPNCSIPTAPSPARVVKDEATPNAHPPAEKPPSPSSAASGRKITRTKSEEDLLIPSSSSSTCSDDDQSELKATDDRDWVDMDEDENVDN